MYVRCPGREAAAEKAEAPAEGRDEVDPTVLDLGNRRESHRLDVKNTL